MSTNELREMLIADVLGAEWPGATGRDADLGITRRVAEIIADHLIENAWTNPGNSEL